MDAESLAMSDLLWRPPGCIRRFQHPPHSHSRKENALSASPTCWIDRQVDALDVNRGVVKSGPGQTAKWLRLSGYWSETFRSKSLSAPFIQGRFTSDTPRSQPETTSDPVLSIFD
jgi:hypothetical protein